MAEDEKDVLKVNQYDGIMINEYNGKINLNAVERGSNEVWYKVWCFLSSWSKEAGGPVPNDKKRVMSVHIGDSKAEAVTNLRKIIDLLVGENQT